MRTWAIANQKGGVGKTTTTLSIGRGLASRGLRVLMLDLDPHSSLTRAFGVPDEPAPRGVVDLFDPAPPALAELAMPTAIAGLDLIASQATLATLERRSATQPGLGMALSQTFAHRAGLRWDYVLLDCPPMLGLLMVNALAAADHLVVPTQTEPLALHGLAGMQRTAQMVARSRQRPLQVSVLPTLYDRRTGVANETLRKMHDASPGQVWDDAIPLDTRLSNILSLTQPLSGDRFPGRGTSAYRRALDWLLERDHGEPDARP